MGLAKLVGVASSSQANQDGVSTWMPPSSVVTPVPMSSQTVRVFVRTFHLLSVIWLPNSGDGGASLAVLWGGGGSVPAVEVGTTTLSLPRIRDEQPRK